MTDWKETEGDRWGPVAFSSSQNRFSETVDVTIDSDGDLEVRSDCEGSRDVYSYIPLGLIRSLIRAHDLRVGAPGTECRSAYCYGGRERDFRGHWKGPCRRCHGSGRNLTPAELERWKGCEK